MSTVYTNDLRLKEIGTGLESGTWGTSTNTNLSLIAEAFSYQTEATFTADSDFTGSDAAIIADGATDNYRAMYVKVTSTTNLTGTRTLEIGPNTCSKIIFIENATSGAQAITIKQGSGATQTIANGKSKLLFLEGTGASAGVIDALDKIEIGSSATIGGVTPISADSTTTLTNKSIDSANNTITNIVNADVKSDAAIDATKIANGTISNTEFQYLNGVSSNIQTQLDTKTTLQAVYPVGSIYISVSSTNPASIFGFGTWTTANTTGRMLIGVQSSNARWNTPLETGGSETVTLTENQIPSHRHGGIYPSGASGSFSQAFDVDHPQTGADLLNQKYTNYTGGNASHDNMPPFLAVYMWRRTA